MTSREEALRALEKEMQADGGRVEYYTGRLSAILATASEQAPVSDEYGWVDGPPHRILSKEEGEWFIAETTYGDRVVLKGLPEEYTYDFTTADGTYWKREFIKRWRQFPDSEYKPLGEPSPAHTSEARDAARYQWMRRGLANTKLLPDGVADLFANALDQNDATKFDAAIDAAMRQEAGK